VLWLTRLLVLRYWVISHRSQAGSTAASVPLQCSTEWLKIRKYAVAAPPVFIAECFWITGLSTNKLRFHVPESSPSLSYVFIPHQHAFADLSDDEVVGAIAVSGWEQGAQPVQDVDDNKQLMKLELTREGFFGLVSIVEP